MEKNQKEHFVFFGVNGFAEEFIALAKTRGDLVLCE